MSSSKYPLFFFGMSRRVFLHSFFLTREWWIPESQNDPMSSNVRLWRVIPLKRSNSVEFANFRSLHKKRISSSLSPCALDSWCGTISSQPWRGGATMGFPISARRYLQTLETGSWSRSGSSRGTNFRPTWSTEVTHYESMTPSPNAETTEGNSPRGSDPIRFIFLEVFLRWVAWQIGHLWPLRPSSPRRCLGLRLNMYHRQKTPV